MPCACSGVHAACVKKSRLKKVYLHFVSYEGSKGKFWIFQPSLVVPSS